MPTVYTFKTMEPDANAGKRRLPGRSVGAAGTASGPLGALVVLATAAALLLSGGWRPAVSPDQWFNAAAGDPVGVSFAVLRCLADGVVLRLVIGLGLTAASWLPGWAGLLAGRGARRVTPTSWHRFLRQHVPAAAVAVSLSTAGMGLPGLSAHRAPPGVGSAGGAAAAAGTALAAFFPGRAAPPGPTPTSDPLPPWSADPLPPWSAPGLSPSPGVNPSPAGSSSPTAAAVTPGPPPPATGTAGCIRVQPGDTLWALTADLLSTTDPVRLAQGWPALWAANRSVIGADPNLLYPGELLRVPFAPPTPPPPCPAAGAGS